MDQYLPNFRSEMQTLKICFTKEIPKTQELFMASNDQSVISYLSQRESLLNTTTV